MPLNENSRTSAIGVILLTAHNLQNYEVSGYRVGADAYVAKPFSLEVLFSRIDNLVARQNKIHKNSQPIKEIPISEVAVEKSEDLFLVKCTETIETEIADPRFDVLQLCRKIGVSRSQLYRRILALTGLTPIQFIRSIRLKHAASFLAQDGTLPVNEVMYRVGYTNLSHFAKIFHEDDSVGSAVTISTPRSSPSGTGAKREKWTPRRKSSPKTSPRRRNDPGRFSQIN